MKRTFSFPSSSSTAESKQKPEDGEALFCRLGKLITFVVAEKEIKFNEELCQWDPD